MIAPAQIVLAMIALIGIWPLWLFVRELRFQGARWKWVPIAYALVWATAACGLFIDLSATQVFLAIACLLALWPTWITAQRLIYSRRSWLWLPLMSLSCVGLCALGIAITFAKMAKDRHMSSTFNAANDLGATDSYSLEFVPELKKSFLSGLESITAFALFGLIPIIAIAFTAYVVDHVLDRVAAAILTTAGFLATAILPICFIVANPVYVNRASTKQQPPVVNAADTPPSDKLRDTNSSSPFSKRLQSP